jgi:hypothetical protein
MDPRVLELLVAYFTKGSASLPITVTLGTTPIVLTLHISSGKDGRMEFDVSLPATTFRL